MNRNLEPGMVEHFEIQVGMGEVSVTESPHILMAVGIGSCVAVTLYDRDSRIGSFAHIMLPRTEKGRFETKPVRFADVAISTMIHKMESRAVQIQNVKAKIFGGANMFPGITSSNGFMAIGRRNILSVREELIRHNIPIIAEEVGDHVGRTVLFDTTDGSVWIRTAYSNVRKY